MKPTFSYEEDQNQNPTLFWVNPWNGKREVLAHFFWPTHEVHKTRLVEEFYELMGAKCAEAAKAAWEEINKMERGVEIV